MNEGLGEGDFSQNFFFIYNERFYINPTLPPYQFIEFTFFSNPISWHQYLAKLLAGYPAISVSSRTLVRIVHWSEMSLVQPIMKEKEKKVNSVIFRNKKLN